MNTGGGQVPCADLAVGAHVARKRELAVIGSVLAVQPALVALVPARVTVAEAGWHRQLDR